MKGDSRGWEEKEEQLEGEGKEGRGKTRKGGREGEETEEEEGEERGVRREGKGPRVSCPPVLARGRDAHFCPNPAVGTDREGRDFPEHSVEGLWWRVSPGIPERLVSTRDVGT